jgi:YjbE family integral membrane protein
LTTVLLRILQIIWLDLLLSGDNAVMIGLAARRLRAEQRRRAVIFGAMAAIVLRVAFAVLLVWFLRLPFLKLVGGIFLFLIAVRATRQDHADHSTGEAKSVWAAVRLIVVADALMSLDNVLAITAAARDDIRLVGIGLLLSLPIVVFGASLVIKALQRAPWLLYASAALIGWTAGQMIADDEGLAVAFAGLPHADLLFGSAGAALVLFAVGAEKVYERLRAA